MTPDLASLEIVFLAHSAAIERPWPPDPYMKAGARAAFCAEMAELHLSIVDRKIDELEALRAMIVIVQEEARAALELVDAWSLVGAEYVRVQGAHAVDSPFAQFPADDDAPDAIDDGGWVLDGDGWIRLRGEDEDAAQGE